MSNITYKLINGVQTYLDDHGGFYAEVNGVKLYNELFDGLTQAIEAEKKAEAKGIVLSLACYAVVRDGDGFNFTVESLTLEGLNRNDSSVKWKEREDKGVLFAVPATPNTLAKLTAYAEATTVVVNIDNQLRNCLIKTQSYGGRIKASEYAERMDGLTRIYSLALKFSNTLDKERN